MPSDPADQLARCDYGGRQITAMVRRGCLYGSQFHPEKSGAVGLQILSRFLEL